MGELIIPPGYCLASFYLAKSDVSHTAIVSQAGRISAGPLSTAQKAAIAAAFFNAYKPQYDNTVTFSRTVIVEGNDGPPLRTDLGSSGVGTHVTQTELPPQVAVVVQKYTAFSGRQYRGRYYLPWPTTADVSGTGQLTTAAVTAWQTATGNFLTSFTTTASTGITEAVLLHSIPLGGGSAPTPTDLISLTVSTFTGTQRRRNRRS